TVGRVVGRDREAVAGGERDGGDNRPEDLLPDNRHVRPGADQHRRFNEVAAVSVATATDGCLGTVGETGVEVAADPLELLGRNEGSHLRGGVQPGTESDLAGLVGDAAD